MLVTLPHVAAALQRRLGPVADQAARASGVTRRASTLTGARFVQTRVRSWLTRPDGGRERWRQTAARRDLEITKHGIDDRFTPTAVACLELVVAAAVQTVLTAAPLARPVLARWPGGVWVHDRSGIGRPDALGSSWPGCGGSAGPSAALTLHGRLDLLSGVLDGPPPGLVDLGCFSLAEVRRRRTQQTDWLSRLPLSTVVVTADGRRWDPLARLLAEAGTTVDLAVTVGLAQRLPARLVAARVPPEVADQRRRRVREEARTQGQAPNPERLALGGWTGFITRVPAARLTVRAALVLARVRWPIELLVTRWKRHHQVEAWATANPWRSLCEVAAKLLGVLVQHWLVLVGGWH